MNRQAIVGVFAILALVALFGVFYVLSDFGTRTRGYKIGVLFKSATGLRPGGIVYESGVTIGTVDQVILNPDYTVEVIIAVRPNFEIPRNAVFTIQTPLTGDPTVLISPPAPALGRRDEPATPAPSAEPVLPHEVLPLAEQPRGRTPISVSELLEQGQAEFRRVDTLLGELQTREPKLLDTLQTTLANANDLSVNANRETAKLFTKVDALTTALQGSITDASANIVDLTHRLDTTVSGNQGRINALLASLNSTATSLGDTVDSLRSLAQNREVRGDLINTTRRVSEITTTLSSIVHDFKDVSGSRTSKAQLRDTVANIDAATQKANSLLGELGGKSSVYGVDPGATPPPADGSAPSTGAPRPTGSPHAGTSTAPGSSVDVRGKLSALTKNLVQTQVRISGLSSRTAHGSTSPLLTGDNGPQTDFNLIILPTGKQSLFLGANDIGSTSTTTSYNFMLRKSPAPGVQIGAGVLYSRLGALGSFDRGKYGAEGRVYDLRHPTLDAYGHFNATPLLQIFGGERDLTHDGRRTVFGVQALF